MKEQKLANSLNIPLEKARELMTKYMAKWKAVGRFFDGTQNYLAENSYVYTFLGRRRYLPDIRSPQPYQRFRAGRQGANSIIQGAAAEIAKCSMLRLHREKRLEQIGWRLLLQIHDELVCEGPPETLELAKAIIKDAMENPFAPFTTFGAPLQAKPVSGPSWWACK